MPNSPGTTNTPVRFTLDDRAKIEDLRSAWRLPTVAAVLRRLIGEAHEKLAGRKP